MSAIATSPARVSPARVSLHTLSTRLDEQEALAHSTAEAVLALTQVVDRLATAVTRRGFGVTQSAPTQMALTQMAEPQIAASVEAEAPTRARDALGRYLPAGAPKAAPKATTKAVTPKGTRKAVTPKAAPVTRTAPKVVTQTAQLPALRPALCKATREAFVAAALAEGRDFRGMGTGAIAQVCVADPGLVPAGFRIGERYTEKFSG